MGEDFQKDNTHISVLRLPISITEDTRRAQQSLGFLSRSVMSDSFAAPRTIACQVPLTIGFSRQEYWSGLLFPSLGYPPNPGMELLCPVSPALAGGFYITEPSGKPHVRIVDIPYFV